MIVSSGDFRYQLDESWPRLPEGWSLGTPSDVAVDSRDRVYVFNRHKHPVAVFEAANGNFVTSWGEGEFNDPHGIYIDPDDFVWVTDTQNHVVTKHTQLGEMVLELGIRGRASPTVTAADAFAGPFNMPAGVAVGSDGSVFVADGYGNRQVHRFSPEGNLELSWGTGGTDAGQFSFVHNLGVDSQDRVLVCDRENSRLQLFDRDGKYLATWDDVLNPADVYISPDGLVYVAEQGRPTGEQPVGVSVFAESGELVSRFRGEQAGLAHPHGIWGDSAGNLFIAELGGHRGGGNRVLKYAKL